MDMVTISVRAQSSKEDIAGNVPHFANSNTFLKCWGFLNKTEIIIQKYFHHDVIHTLPTVKTENMSTNRTIRTKQSLLACTRYCKAKR